MSSPSPDLCRGVSGILPMALAAREAASKRCFVPAENAAEATLAGGTDSLRRAGRPALTAASQRRSFPLPPLPMVAGEETGLLCRICRTSWGRKRKTRPGDCRRRRHNLLLIGSPGAGKSMLAKRLPSILPDLTRQGGPGGIRGVVRGGTDGSSTPADPAPVPQPHHTASAAALTGGGPPLRPGEISLAHNGVAVSG